MMNTRIRRTAVTSFLVIGLVAVAGICSGVRPALAQLDCPPPRPEPSVTAQH